MWSEIKRKLFHLLGLIYVIGLIYVPPMTYLYLLTALLLVVFIIEQARLRMPPVSAWFERHFGNMLRERERHRMSGVFWMLMGVWMACVLLKSVPLAATAILYLLFGDSVASLMGKRLRGPRWPGSEKSISGSLACFVMCLAIGAMLLRPQYYGWSGIVLGALVATIVEGFPLKLDDNATIPIAAALTFLLCYG